MRKPSIAVVVGGLAMMPLAAMSQNMASAPTVVPKTDQMLFMDGGARVPPSAMATVRDAVEAAKAKTAVRIEGRADMALAVKQEMVRQGAPADRITVRVVASRPLVNAGDGMSDPIERKVELKY